MKNLNTQLKLPEIKVSEIGDMLKLVALEYPDLKDFNKIAEIITSTFKVLCTKEDIEGYYSQLIISEDYELENRRQEYGINI